MKQEGDRSALLLESATPTLYRKNAFRVLSLSVNASPRKVKRQVERVRLQVKLSEPVGDKGELRPLIPDFEPSPDIPYKFEIYPTDLPDLDTAREAAQRLNDPERRLIDEFFWFWPHLLGSKEQDAAFDALQKGDIEEARRVWLSWEAQETVSNVSIHNLAVLNHLMALDLELRSSSDLSIDEMNRRDSCWAESHKRWRLLLGDEGFWARLNERIKELDDPRLTNDTARRFRDTLPIALLLINGLLAISSAEEGRDFDLLRHERMMSESGFDKTVINDAKLAAIGPIRERVRTICRSTEQDTDKDPVHADEVALRILDSKSISHDLKAVDVLMGAEHPSRSSLRDEVALQVHSSVLSFARKTEQWDDAISLLKRGWDIAASDSTKLKINESISAFEENAKSDFGWCGAGYFDLPEKLLSQLERAREYAIVFDWDRAIGLLEKLYEEWTSEKQRRLIGKPLALCRNMRANMRLSKAFHGLEYRYAPIPQIKRLEIQRAVSAAGEDLVRAYELDPQNNTIRKNYNEVRDIASKIGVSIPRTRRAPKPQTARTSSTRPPPRTPSSQRRSSGVSGCGVIAIILGLLIGGSFLLSLCSGTSTGGSTRSPTRTIRPTKVPTRRPTNTSRPVFLPTRPPSPQCVNWSQVDLLDEGKWMCVKGNVKRWYKSDSFAFVVIFSEEPGTFIFVDTYWRYPEVKTGDCVAAEGRVEIMSKVRPYINVNGKLMTCY